MHLVKWATTLFIILYLLFILGANINFWPNVVFLANWGNVISSMIIILIFNTNIFAGYFHKRGTRNVLNIAKRWIKKAKYSILTTQIQEGPISGKNEKKYLDRVIRTICKGSLDKYIRVQVVNRNSIKRMKDFFRKLAEPSKNGNPVKDVFLYAYKGKVLMDFDILLIDNKKGCIVYPEPSKPRSIDGGWFFRDSGELYNGIRMTFELIKQVSAEVWDGKEIDQDTPGEIEKRMNDLLEN